MSDKESKKSKVSGSEKEYAHLLNQRLYTSQGKPFSPGLVGSSKKNRNFDKSQKLENKTSNSFSHTNPVNSTLQKKLHKKAKGEKEQEFEVTKNLQPLLGRTVAIDGSVSPRPPTKAPSLLIKDDHNKEEPKDRRKIMKEKFAKNESLDQKEYENYLRSPFSFIDKVIDNPYTEEFVYLNPNGPYNLKIVKHNEIQADNYCTMSRSGVTHYYKGDTEFTTLDQWEREFFLYSKIMDIDFFAKYRTWKAFYFWKKFISRTKRKKYKKILDENLYVLNPFLRPSLVELKRLCYEVSSWNLYKIDTTSTLTLEQFEITQAEQQEEILNKLQDLYSEIKSEVLKACDIDLREFLIANGFRKKDGLDDDKKGGADEDEDLGFSQKISHAERAAIRTKCRKLTKYIRLSDYFIIDTLVTLCMDRTYDLNTSIQRPPPSLQEIVESKSPDQYDYEINAMDDELDMIMSNVPIFSVELVYNDGALQFSPELEKFQQSLESIVISVVKRVMSPARLVSDEEFQQFTQVNAEEGDEDAAPDFQVELMVLQDDGFIEVVRHIKEGIANTFKSAEEYKETFNSYLNMFLENNETKVQECRDFNLKEFNNIITKYEEQLALFEQMRESAEIGILKVETINLKQFMLPSPKKLLKEVQTLLPSVANEKSKNLLNELQDSNKKISAIPATVEEFVEIMKFLQEIRQGIEDINQRYQFIFELYKVINEHEIKVSDDERLVFEKLTQTLQTFKMSITFCEASIDTNTQRFGKELNDNIPILEKAIKTMKVDLENPKIHNPESDIETIISELEDKEAKLTEMEERAKRYEYYQEVLEVPVSSYDELKEIRMDLDLKLQLWSSLQSWNQQTDLWTGMKFSSINIEDIDTQVKLYNKIYAKAKRMLATEDVPEHPVAMLLRARVAKFQNTLPVVLDLRNKHLLPRHWEEIRNLLGNEVDPDDDSFTMGKLLKMNAMEHRNEIASISSKAVQESVLRDMLDKIINLWSDLDFPVNVYKDQKDVYTLGNLEDVMTALDDSLVTINTIMGSRFVEPYKEEVVEWNGKLMLFQETLDEWITCQRGWMYLENIFAAQDIVRQLAEESTIFNKVDKGWKEIMRRTNDSPNAINAGTYPGLREQFQHFNVTLEKVQKRLEQYLETKRQAFPRFYFLSNDELLEILAQSKNVEAVQPHLRKCFDNIVRLEFQDKDIIAMFSSEGERVPLGRNNRHTQARSLVEIWLSALEADMVNTLSRFMKKALLAHENTPRKKWVIEQFGQMVMTVSQIAWCEQCEAAITSDKPKKALQIWLKQQKNQLKELTELVRGNLSNIDRKKIVSLVTTDVHARDVTERLIADDVSDLNNFAWQQQLRFYWNQEDDCIVRQSNAMFHYGYEYMGVCSRLVITPLTDRCWMTITGALHIRLGASPAGPAGTGKTESTKDLAKAMGFLCVVFNCSEQIDYKMMGKLFSGLCQCGAWSCLDEFNRIGIEVLSVIAQQILQIRQALLANSSSFVFQDCEISLKSGFGVMITMNPGYAGRTELPDNLKVLFRPVAMMIPDYAQIAEIMLYAEGFDSASILAQKMVKLYKLSSEQLSQQDHYDFGMRAVKSVLVMAGALKRAEPNSSEDVVLIRAMRDSNVPKFLSEDLPLFHALVQDLFPGLVIPEIDYGELKVAIHDVIKEMGLQIVDDFVTKVIQLYDTFNVRFGVMLVGPTGGGKSECYRVLAKAMTLLRTRKSLNETFQNVQLHVLNPKCIQMGELYGEVDQLTQEWSDGLASTIMREAIKDTSKDRHWVVFDGPVDSLWIENMNTVLDDNMTLCLANSERIKLKPELRMLFEVQDLAVASPATVSRCGMVYITPESLGCLPYVRSWIPTLKGRLNSTLQEYVLSLFEKHIPIVIQWKHDIYKELIRTPDITTVTSVCMLFDSLFSAENKISFEETTEELQPLVDMIYSFALIWGVGGSISEESREHFAKACVELLPNAPPGNVFDSFVNVQTRQWQQWESILPKFEYKVDQPYFQILVPTVDTVRFAALLDICTSIGRASFFTGVTGVGKSLIVNDFFRKSGGEKGLVSVVLSFSAQTSSKRTQETIENSLIKLRKNRLGPPAGKKCIIFVDDVNMPSVEKFGAQPPIELLRQFQDHKGFYDRKKLFWKNIQDTTIVCAAAPAGGGRSELTMRFVRHFSMFSLPAPNETRMVEIFSGILGGFLMETKPDLKHITQSVVKATVNLYEDISKDMLPTPAKSHYTFNLRDISKVFQGIVMVYPLYLKGKDEMIKLWIHEAERCFCDRLINNEDRKWFQEEIVSLLKKHYSCGWTVEEVFQEQRLIFCEFLRPGVERLYEEAISVPKVVQLLDDYLEEYNMASSHAMNLVFFEDAVLHIVRISRILRQPRGNAMLVGVGGSGKQSLTRLACFMMESQCMQVEITRGFGYPDFQEQLKKMMLAAGVAGKSTVFLFTENQILEERFLEDVNNILNSGEVPNLWEADELVQIVEDLTPTAKDLGLLETKQIIYDLFVERVRDNLHIVLCMSPVGDSFRKRCRMFPSLINCTTIDWFSKWPREALLSVSQRYLKELEVPREEMKDQLAELCVEAHLSLEAMCNRFYEELRRKVYTTPKSYLDLISLYLSLLSRQREEMNQNRLRLISGLGKLKEANDIVAELKGTLVKLQPQLKVKSEETQVLLEQVAVDQQKANKVRVVVEEEEKLVKKQQAEVAAIHADAQAELDLALPAYNSARDALKALKKSDVAEVKVMGKPPEGVILVMKAVCLLLNEEPDWETAKKVMANPNFLKTLYDFDKDNIPEKTIKQLKKYLNHPLFNEEAMKKISFAATSLCKWTKAMVNYSNIAKEVEPKKQRLKKMNELLEEATHKLQEKQAQLQEVTSHVEKLKQKCEETMNEKEELDRKMKQCHDRLERAEKLTSGLADERVRWAEEAESILGEMENLVGDMFISSACISYFGAFTGEYRNELVTKWHRMVLDKNIPCSGNPSEEEETKQQRDQDESKDTAVFSLSKVLGDPVQIREWNMNGLPTDDVSIDSGVIVFRAERWPLMIDPQGQAKKWIKNQYKSKLIVTRFEDPNMLRVLEAAVRNGNALLIEDVGETIDASIDPILLKQTYQQGARMLIRLGDNDVDYDPAFKFFMTTKKPNPHYMPEVCIKVSLLNFAITRKGLEDQLLGDVVKKERPDIEEKKNRLVVSMAADRKQLKDIEDRILKLLSESSGMILDDVDLIQTLGDSKFTANVINERMKEAEVTQQQINTIREKYRPVATRGSNVYFVVSDLALIDPMYQYSLSYFSNLFNLCIDNSEPSNVLEERLNNLMKYMTDSIYANVCRGLFESHKLIFSFLICTEIMRGSGQIGGSEWNLFIRGASRFEMRKEPPNPNPKLFTQIQWQLICALDNFGGGGGANENGSFEGLKEDILKRLDEVWVPWITQSDCHKKEYPSPWNKCLSSFKRLLLMKALRPEKLMFALANFVEREMGTHFVASLRVRLEDVYKDTDAKTPIIFVLSQGADPTSILMRFAHQMKYADRLQVISLGQGQGEHAKRLIDAATKNGDWVLLQNCHLAKSWMPSMEKIVEHLAENEQKVNETFRLWLTSMPCEYFPVPVLQSGVKLTNEPPKGLKANLMRSINNVLSPEEFESCTKPKPWKKLLFGLLFFHASVQERKMFGPLGWNKMYEFNDSDLETSIQVLRMFLEEQSEIPWDALRYVCGEINYGGRVTDDWDRRCLMSILNKFYTPNILNDETSDEKTEMYKFSPSGTYYAPKEGPLSSWIEYVESLPTNADPEIFGMHENANLTFQLNESEKILGTILSIQPREVVGSEGLSSDDIVREIAENIEQKLPPLLDRKNAGEYTFGTKDNGVLDSLATVLLQEMDRFNKLRDVMVRSLIDLRKAIKGEMVMSPELDKMYSSFLNNKVPELWSTYAYPSLKPLASWVQDFNKRVLFMEDWLLNGQPNVFWLSGFFFPQGFMTGTLQNYARKYKVPIDSLSFRFEVLDAKEPKDVAASPKDGVLIHGLYLDGARWDNKAKVLEDSHLGELHPTLPIIHFIPEKNYEPEPNLYACPVYKTSVRAGVLSTTGHSTNFVLPIYLPSKKEQDYWILKGAAILCQLDT